MIVQDQVLIGTVLGGSTLAKPPRGSNYYLSMRSSNKDWLLYKASEMSHYFKRVEARRYGATFRVNSCCCESLTSCHAMMYDGPRRKVTMGLLDRLRDVGIAVWYLDNGGRTGRGRKNAYLNTTAFGEEGTETACRYFNEVDMPCRVNRTRGRLKVLFSVAGTEALFATIAFHFPPFMDRWAS